MSETKKLNNADFRKILATQSHHAATEKKSTFLNAPTHAFTHRKYVGAQQLAEKKKLRKHHHSNKPPRNDQMDSKRGGGDDDPFDEEAEVKLNEILKNYRDRAAERRKGVLPTELQNDVLGLKLLGESKEIGGVLDASSMEARNMQIQKSKYLGGDMEHTHLVKGLDYSLLNKVRTELEEQQSTRREHTEKAGDTISSLEASQANNKLAKSICKVLFESKAPQRNELFARGRMAYLVEIEGEEEAEIPSTLLRSICHTGAEQTTENINADNLLINKLTQVLAYLRTDVKKKKKGTDEMEMKPQQYDGKQQDAGKNIFEGLDDYVPAKSDHRRRKDEESRDRRADQKQHSSYFDSKLDRKERRQEEEAKRQQQRMERKRKEEEEAAKKQQAQKEEILQKKKRKLEEEEAYAELYPGGLGMIDAGGESDDDDFSKMDPGNKKPPVKRWDFDSQDDFEKYQNQREANPRAAYQYGLKTSGGRKTRKNATAANERKIDRELEKINKIMEKGISQSIRY